MQLLYITSPRNVATIIYILLSQIALAFSLPVDQHESSLHENEARAPHSHTVQPLTKRAALSSSAVGAIGGGAVGLILLALVIGLGSASIAILGSLEWGEFRDRKKPQEEQQQQQHKARSADAEKQKGFGQEQEQDKEAAVSIHQTQSNLSTASTAQQTVREEKIGIQTPVTPRRSRLTLKSFLAPMDFNPTWLHNHSNNR